MLKQNSFGIKVLSLVLSVLMTISALPLSVFAIESTDGNTEEIADNLNLVKDVVEIKELRDENVKHFRLEDGSYMAAQYEVPVHYLDENGDWQDIDNSLTESGSEISTKNAKIKFAKKITGNGTLLTIHESNHKITMSLDGAIKKTTGSIIDNNSMDGSTKLQKMLTLENLSARVLYKDLSKYFDTLNHELLMNMLRQEVKDKRLTDLIKKYLKSGVMENGIVMKTEEGSPQGGNLSPLLANIYLDKFDKEFEGRGVKVIRYADDIVLLAKSIRAAERLLGTSTSYLEKKLKLKVNTEKSRAVSVYSIRNFGFSALRWEGTERVHISGFTQSRRRKPKKS